LQLTPKLTLEATLEFVLQLMPELTLEFTLNPHCNVNSSVELQAVMTRFYWTSPLLCF